MIACTVESQKVGYLVRFEDGMDLLLQFDWDYAQFAVDCGAVKAPENWDGRPSKLGKALETCDFEDIVKCPDEYHAQAMRERYNEED